MLRKISEGDAWVTNEDGDIIGIQLHGRSEVVDLSNPVNGKVNLVTGGVWFSRPVALGVSAVSRNTVRGVLADLAQGRSSSIFLLGDSTGNETTEWFYLLSQRIAALYPSIRVEYKGWDGVTFDYGTTTVIQEGSSGERWVGGGNMIPHGSVAEWTTDLDVRVKIKHNTWLPAAAQTLLSKFGNAGNRSFRFELETSSGAPRMAFRWTADGTNELAVASSTFTKDAGTALWLRAAIDVDNGSGGYTVTFYKSDDGVSWTQVSQSVTTSGITSVYKSTAHFEAGSRSNNGTTPIDGVVYKASARDGIGGATLLPVSIDDFLPMTNATEPLRGGSPTLYVINGSQSGQNIAYFTTNYLKMVPRMNIGQFFISTGHNEPFSTAPSDISGLITLIRSRIPFAPGYAIMQNPRIGVATMQERQKQFVALFAEVSRKSGLDAIDVFRAFAESPNIADLISAADGIHPTAAGSELWRNVVFNTAF